MRVLLTGHIGFTGTYLRTALQDHGHEVVLFDADLRDAGQVDAAVAAAAPKAVIHLAALSFAALDDVAAYYAVNQIGTFTLLAALQRHAPGIEVILASSANVYGNTSEGRLSEETPFHPANHYAASKAAMELGAMLWARSLSIKIVRPFNYTGVGQAEEFLIPKIVKHFRERRAVIELGNLDVDREFGDVRSVAQAYCGLLGNPTGHSVFNICSGQGHSIRDVIGILSDLTGHDIDVRVNPAFVRANEVRTLIGSASRLAAALPRWSPPPLEETLRWMLDAG